MGLFGLGGRETEESIIKRVGAVINLLRSRRMLSSRDLDNQAKELHRCAQGLRKLGR